MTPNHMGKRIRARREALSLSREDLAARMTALGSQIRAQQIFRWEEESVTPKTATRIAALERALDVSAGWLGHGSNMGPAAALTHSALIEVLDKLIATAPERSSLQMHLASREAAHEWVTPAYVIGFVQGLRATASVRDAAATAVTTQAIEGMLRDGRSVVPAVTNGAPRGKRKRKNSGAHKRV